MINISTASPIVSLQTKKVSIGTPDEGTSSSRQSIKMVNRLKSLVSKKKIRFQSDGFDLDLTYISPRIIAMGFPAERLEGIYRNHIEEVSRFFEQRHRGHYKIYHLCNERDFDACYFSGPVLRYPFSDHNAPRFDQIISLAKDVKEFLHLHPHNVVAINCKAGKGRTGVMVCACLIEMQEAKDSDEALRIYAEKRTRDGQGVTIPSQRRYVNYYSHLINADLCYEPTSLKLVGIQIDSLQNQLHGIQGFDISLSVYKQTINGCMCESIHNNDSKSVSDLDNNCSPTCRSNVSPKSYSNGLKSSTLSDEISRSRSIPSSELSCHNCGRLLTFSPTVVSLPFPCSTNQLEGAFFLRLSDPVLVNGDFRVKLKVKQGVMSKKIGQCWLNTFFISSAWKKTPVDEFSSEFTSLSFSPSSQSENPLQLPPTLLAINLSQSDLDYAFKGKARKLPCEEFQVSFLFIPETSCEPELPCSIPSPFSSHYPPSYMGSNL